MLVKNFFDEDFKVFSNLDNVRSIPSIIDGFKDSQRKAVYGMFCHGQSEIKVAQLGGFASLVSHYNHGETSMCDTIVGLAQNYPGSNNVNLFEPIGQFGSILSSESSAHRYIFTKPSENLRKYIRKEDDCILEHRYEDGDKAEPIHYYPVLPMWILNGSVGIGTGHSVKILPRDPKKVKDIVVKLINGVSPNRKTINEAMMPYYDGWKGSITYIEDKNQYEIYGCIEQVNTTTIRVTELPVGYGIDKFKAILVDLIDAKVIKDFDNNSTEAGINFEISVPRETGKKTEEELIKLFKLMTRVTENVTLWSTDGTLKRYNTVYDALVEFVDYTEEKYERRRLKHIEINQSELDFLTDKKRFIINWNKLDNPGKMETSDIVKYMIDNGVNEDNIDKLMQLRISSLSKDQIEKLDNEIGGLQKVIEELNNVANWQLYLEDLKDL